MNNSWTSSSWTLKGFHWSTCFIKIWSNLYTFMWYGGISIAITIKPKSSTTQTKSSKNLRPGLALIKCRFQFYRSEKLGQCLDIDDITPPRKFDDVTWPSSHFIGRSVFIINQHLVEFTDHDIDLKFSKLIFIVNIDIPAKFCKITMPKRCISKYQLILGFSLVFKLDRLCQKNLFCP